MSDKQFAARLREAMKKTGFTQESLAKSVGVSQPAVSRWLKGSQPALAVGIHLSTVLNVDHRWLMEGIGLTPDVTFDDGTRRRLIKARLLEGMELADVARITALPEQTFAAVEKGDQAAHPNLVVRWIKALNAEERFILEGRGRLFKSEAKFILIPPEKIDDHKAELERLRTEADFLQRRIERLSWELAESVKAHKEAPYHPRIISSPRKRLGWGAS